MIPTQRGLLARHVGTLLTFLLSLGAAAALLGHRPAWVAITLMGTAVVATGCQLVL